ncbi:MAG: hypothetical protein Q9162_003143 [Coniocarpon cinnabarinum]
MRVSSEYTLGVPADRAILSLELHVEGTSRNQVAFDLETLQNEVIGLMHPISQRPFSTSTSPNSSQAETQELPSREPAIIHVGIDTLQATSYEKRQTILGGKPLYEASMNITAEFSDFDALGLVVNELTGMSNLRIQSLEWKLKEMSRSKAATSCQRNASEMLMSKAKALAAPLGFDNVRATSVYEQAQKQEAAAFIKLISDESTMHDEMGSVQERPKTVNQQDFAPKSLTFAIELSGEFEAW